MNEIAKYETNHGQVSPWAEYANDVLASAIAGDLLKFAKGDWLRGEGNEAVPDDASFLTNMNELWTGWQRWEDGHPVEHRLSRLIDRAPKIQRDELGYTDKSAWETDNNGAPRDPWQMTDRLVMRDDATQELCTFATSSYGGQWGLAKLLRAYAQERHKFDGRFPVVKLDVDRSWRHPKYGPIPRPLFTIIGWAFWDDDAPMATEPTTPAAKLNFSREIDDDMPF